MADTQRMDWHAQSVERLWDDLSAQPDGLNGDEPRRRLAESGPNALHVQEGAPWWKMLVMQVHNPLVYLLIVAAGVSLLSGHVVDAGVIAGVVVVNSLLGFMQEWRAEGALAALRNMTAPHARVLRDGDAQDIDAAGVVPGDILLLETGARVAADARMIASDDLHVDEAALTGESEPVAKQAGQFDADTPIGDRKNMVWMSTNVTAGRGRAVVVATGMNTQIGRIAGEVQSTEREETPLQKRMARLSLVLGIGGVALSGVIFVLGLLRGKDWIEMALYAVAVAVSAIPEGLPAVITVTLALGVRRMTERNAIIRRLPAVETLGSTTVICTDKTGTLTASQMTVRAIWADGKTFDITGEGYRPEGEIRAAGGEPVGVVSPGLDMLLRVGSLANNAELEQDPDGTWRIEGNPSEAALLAAAIKGGLDGQALRNETPRIDEVTFSSAAKYMATLNPSASDGPTAMVKGAPDRILARCTHVLIDGETVELDDARRVEIERVNGALADQAMRVLAGAYRVMPEGTSDIEADDVEHDLTLAGLWGMIDPPRPQSEPAVRAAREAGIRPVLITGDYARTAAAIARQVGIAGEGDPLGPAEIESLPGPDLAAAAKRTGVFARVSPEHKLTILQALKGEGDVVAMTGDGVNDAPALKGADIGVAMGQTGTEVAKEAADMVLADDNFATIVHAIEQGRVIFGNLRRVVFFLLATNLGEVLTLAGALLLGLELPLTAVMILWVNLVTDGACTVPLGIEPRHGDVLKHPPRDPNESILYAPLIARMFILTPLMAAGTLLLFWLECRHYAGDGNGLPHAQTIAFTTLSAFQWFQALNARSEHLSVFKVGLFRNRWLLAGLAAAVGLQILAVQTPIGNAIFGTVSLTWADWLWIVLVSSSIWVVDECIKALGLTGGRRRLSAG